MRALGRLGVSKLLIRPGGEGRFTVTLEASPAAVNGEAWNLAGESFTVTGQEGGYGIAHTSAKSGTRLELSATDGYTVLTTNESRQVLTEEVMDRLSPNRVAVVYILSNLLETVKLHLNETEVDLPVGKPMSCDYVQISGGLGRSTSEARCQRGLDRFLSEHKDCRPIGSCDTSCITSNHLCATTVVIRCWGDSCKQWVIGIGFD